MKPKLRPSPPSTPTNTQQEKKAFYWTNLKVNEYFAFHLQFIIYIQVVYEDYQMIQLTQPYIPGFLAFREMDFMIQLYNNVKENNTQYTPQVSTGCVDTLLNKCVRRSSCA